MRLEGRVALVTGGAARLGGAITLGLAQAGAHVVVHYNHSADAAQATVEQARGFGVQALSVQADLADPQGTQTVVRAVADRFGGTDVLVHAASPFVRGSLHETTLQMHRQVMGVLVESFFLLAQGLAPWMVERGEGVIVVVLDRGAFESWPGFLSHSTGKSALWGMARSLAAGAPAARLQPGPEGPPRRQDAAEALGGTSGRGRRGAFFAALRLRHGRGAVRGRGRALEGARRWGVGKGRMDGSRPQRTAACHRSAAAGGAVAATPARVGAIGSRCAARDSRKERRM
jgi:NAD(P)-dependent dehydrogenase (short-subunit alcohol dehydrogenase family)